MVSIDLVDCLKKKGSFYQHFPNDTSSHINLVFIQFVWILYFCINISFKIFIYNLMFFNIYRNKSPCKRFLIWSY